MVLSTPAQLVAPVVMDSVPLAITTTEIYFEVDEDDPAFKKIDAKVKAPRLFSLSCFFLTGEGRSKGCACGGFEDGGGGASTRLAVWYRVVQIEASLESLPVSRVHRVC